jgi:hypothetical protein
MWSVPRLYNESVFAAKMRLDERIWIMSTEHRVKNHGD